MVRMRFIVYNLHTVACAYRIKSLFSDEVRLDNLISLQKWENNKIGLHLFSWSMWFSGVGSTG